MFSFQSKKLENLLLPMKAVRLLSTLNEFKGKRSLSRQQPPQILEVLKNVAVVQSTKASNSIEGIIITNKRLEGLMKHHTEPQDCSEKAIVGYRDILATIHSAYETIPINSNVILQLHRELYKFLPLEGGRWKNTDNVIEEKLPSGERFVRFRPLSAFETPEAMDELCRQYNDHIRRGEVDPLIIIAAFVFDFLSRCRGSNH